MLMIQKYRTGTNNLFAFKCLRDVRVYFRRWDDVKWQCCIMAPFNFKCSLISQTCGYYFSFIARIYHRITMDFGILYLGSTQQNQWWKKVKSRIKKEKKARIRLNDILTLETQTISQKVDLSQLKILFNYIRSSLNFTENCQQLKLKRWDKSI